MQQLAWDWGLDDSEWQTKAGRDKRQRVYPSLTISVRGMTQLVLEALRDEIPKEEIEAAQIERPRTRGECKDGLRPCPWVSCRHHLYLEITKRGAIKYVFPDIEPEEMQESCVLDIVDKNPEGVTLDTAGGLANITRERVRQIEEVGMAAIAQDMERFRDEGHEVSKRHLHVLGEDE